MFFASQRSRAARCNEAVVAARISACLPLMGAHTSFHFFFNKNTAFFSTRSACASCRLRLRHG